MDAPAANSNNIQFNTALRQAGLNPVAFLQSVDRLLEDFGPEGVSNAASERLLARFGDSLKEIIGNSDLPQSIKDAANDIIDAHCACPNSNADASAAVENSELAGTVDDLCDDATAEVENECCCAAGESDAEATAEAENEGGAAPPSAEADAEASAEAENEGSGGVTTGDDLVNDLAEDGEKKRKGNWLEILASTLAKVQSTFLDKALAAAEVMADQADAVSESGEGKSKEFLQAQAKYTANMQLFTIFSNQVSTSLKSIGEALAGIARKQ